MSSVQGADAPGAPTRQPQPHFEWGDPALVAVLWLLTTIAFVVDQVRFPDFSEDNSYVSSILFLSAAPVLGALVAAAIGRARELALPLAAQLLLVQLIAAIAWLAIEWISESFMVDPGVAGSLIAALAILASAGAIYRVLRGNGSDKLRGATATVLAAFVIFAWQSASMLDGPLMEVAYRYAEDDSGRALPEIDEEKLWGQQPALVATALASIAPPSEAGTDSYVVTVAASGSQDLFGREARLARKVLAAAFGASGRSVTLANDETSLYRVPLASNTNLDAVLAGLGKRIDRSRDVVVIYLTSHGSRQAELTTDLPDNESLEPISARRLAGALNRNGIRRRVIIVSACYSGSWIGPLATADTIVVTAARADRTSFGCSDHRELTYFGEALLKGPLSNGASLAEGFQAARRTVARWERGSPHSEPQVSVGRNMGGVWRMRR